MDEHRVCLVGYGRVGRVTASLLSSWGVKPLVFDSSSRNVDEARRRGLEARLVDASSPGMLREIASSCSVVATALPSRVAVEVVKGLIGEGVERIVDVSYVPDPMAFDEDARQAGSVVFVDTGIAPGLSNMMVAFSSGSMDRVDEALIYVGGVSSKQDSMGLVASWNMEDLVEEYTRPARARIGGREVLLDPVADATQVEVPGAGVFEALPTDGLRTLLNSIDAATLVEYTLRYPGHVELLRGLKRLGFLSDKRVVVEGCSIMPRHVLSKLLEETLPRSGDRVVLYTLVSGAKGEARKRVEYILDETQEALGLEVPLLTYLTGFVHAWFTVRALEGAGRPGVNPPETLASSLPRLLEELKREAGLTVLRRVTYEEEP